MEIFTHRRHVSANAFVPVLSTTLLTNRAFRKIWKTHTYTFLLVLLCYDSGLSAPGDISVCLMWITHVFSSQLQASPPSGLLMMCKRLCKVINGR